MVVINKHALKHIIWKEEYYNESRQGQKSELELMIGYRDIHPLFVPHIYVKVTRVPWFGPWTWALSVLVVSVWQ